MNKYKVTLNWHGEVHTFYTHAKSELSAMYRACYQLADVLEGESGGMRYYSVRQYFNDGKDRWKVERR